MSSVLTNTTYSKRQDYIPMSRPCARSYFRLDTVPYMGPYIKTPKVPVVMKTILMQGRKFSTEEEKFASSRRRSYHGVCRSRTRASRRDEFTPFLFVGAVSEDIIVKVLKNKKKESFFVFVVSREMTYGSTIFAEEFTPNTPEMISIGTRGKCSIRSSARWSFN